jgi:hypothetical protein
VDDEAIASDDQGEEYVEPEGPEDRAFVDDNTGDDDSDPGLAGPPKKQDFVDAMAAAKRKKARPIELSSDEESDPPMGKQTCKRSKGKAKPKAKQPKATPKPKPKPKTKSKPKPKTEPKVMAVKAEEEDMEEGQEGRGENDVEFQGEAERTTARARIVIGDIFLPIIWYSLLTPCVSDWCSGGR